MGGEAVVGGGVEWVEVDQRLARCVRGAHGVDAGLADELFDGAVLDDEDGGPDEVGEEASPENDDEDGKVLPKVEATGGESWVLARSPRGLPASSPKAKKELMMPARMAMATPLPKV